MLKKAHRIFLSLFFIFNIAVTGYLFDTFQRYTELLKLGHTDLMAKIDENIESMIALFNLHFAVFVIILWASFFLILYYARNNSNVTEF